MRRSHAGALGLAFAVLLTVLAAAWVFGPLSQLADPAALARAAQQRARDWPLAPLAVVGVHVALGLVAAPASLLVAATTLTFGAWPGALYAFAGMMANAVVVYSLTRLVAREAVEAWIGRRVGSRVDAVNRLLARRGLIAVLLMRLTPFPYSLQNALAGAAHVAFGDFVVGTAVGILPVITVMAGVASQWDAWIAQPDPIRLVTAGGIALAAVAAGWTMRCIAVCRTARKTRLVAAANTGAGTPREPGTANACPTSERSGPASASGASRDTAACPTPATHVHDQ